MSTVPRRTLHILPVIRKSFTSKGLLNLLNPSITSQLLSSRREEKNQPKEEYIDKIVGILNHKITESKTTENVESHFSSLLEGLTSTKKSILLMNNEEVCQTLKTANSGLWEYFQLLDLNHKLTISYINLIVLNKNFNQYEEILAYANRKNEYAADIKVLLCYKYLRTRQLEKARQVYVDFSQYSKLHSINSKLWWRNTFQLYSLDKVVELCRSNSVGARDLIKICQVLSQSDISKVYDTKNWKLTKNQQLFVETLITLQTPHPDSATLIKRLIKLSIQNKLVMDDKNISMYQFRFIKGMDEILHEMWDRGMAVDGLLQVMEAETNQILKYV